MTIFKIEWSREKKDNNSLGYVGSYIMPREANCKFFTTKEKAEIEMTNLQKAAEMLWDRSVHVTISEITVIE